METTGNNSNLIAILTMGLVLFLAGSLFYWNKSRQLTNQNTLNEQQTDSLQAARIDLESQVRTLSDQLSTAEEDKTALNKRIEEVDRQLANNQVAMRELRRGNSRRTLTIEELNDDLGRLRAVRDSLSAQMTAMENKIKWQTDSVQQLRAQNNDLQNQVTTLDTRLVSMVPRSVVTGDGFRVEAIKSNDRVTAKAKKVDALAISFNIPVELRLEGMQEVYLSLTDERQQAVMPALQNSTVALKGANESVPVHAVQNINFAKNPQRISFRLALTDDLKPGMYRASVYTKNAYLGSVEFQLRDSFWFF